MINIEIAKNLVMWATFFIANCNFYNNVATEGGMVYVTAQNLGPLRTS